MAKTKRINKELIKLTKEFNKNKPKKPKRKGRRKPLARIIYDHGRLS